MALLFWDASGLVKRYSDEAGRQTVNAVFDQTAPHTLATTPWGYAETFSILLRKLNGELMDRPTFEAAVAALQAEVVNGPMFALLPIDSADVFASTGVMRAYNLNATDAAILTVLLDYARSPGAPPCLLVAADRRLLRAAQAEGLATLDPEQTAPDAVPALLAALA